MALRRRKPIVAVSQGIWHEFKERMMRSNLIGIAVVMAFVSSARADAVSDANAGLEALNRGDVVTALRLFNSAIDSGTLSQNDLAFAYVERGETYLQKSEPDHARRDADKALSLNPTDSDAKALWLKTTIQAQPSTREEYGRSQVTFTCTVPGNQNPNYHLTLEVSFGINGAQVPQRWVRSPEFGEQGRKLVANVNDTVVSWHSHEELPNSSEYLDQDMTLNRSTGNLTDSFRTSTGQQGVRSFTCHQ
jgi:tetratricopeptide (TPR) repeat protein